MKTIILTLILVASSLALADPAYFVENQGQWEAPFAFKANIGNATYFVTATGMTIDLREYERPIPSRDPMDRLTDNREPEPVSVRGHVLKLNFVNANPAPQIIGQDQLSSYSNYFLGRDSCNWRGHVPHYQYIMMQDVWPGIDVELAVQPEGIETVYHIAPDADPALIQIEYEGLDSPLQIDANGSLLLETSLGALKEQAPWAYQQERRTQKNIATHYQILSASSYSLAVPTYDRHKELVIDPLLVYSSEFGGGFWDNISQIFRHEPDGNLFLMGDTDAHDLPVTPGAYQDSSAGIEGDGFIATFAPDGRTLVFCTYIGGAGTDFLFDGTVTVNHQICVIGRSHETSGWPLTADALDTVFEGNSEGIMAVLSAAGDHLEYSTYVGGASIDELLALSVAPSGELYFAGGSASDGLFTTPDALFPAHLGTWESGIIMRFDPWSLTFTYSSYYGTSETSLDRIIANGADDVWVSGRVYSENGGSIPVTDGALQMEAGGEWDGGFGHLDLANGEVLYGSYLGGASNDACELVSVSSDTVLLAGHTISPDFPVTENAMDTVLESFEVYVMRLILPATINQCTFLGGDGVDYEREVAVEPNGSLVILGYTQCHDFPTTPGAFDSIQGDGSNGGDLFLSRLSPDWSTLLYSTYLGGREWEQPFDMYYVSANEIWLTALSTSPDFPRTPDAFRSVGGTGAYLRFSLAENTPCDTLPAPTRLTIRRIGNDIRLRWVAPVPLDSCPPVAIEYVIFHADSANAPFLYLDHTDQLRYDHLNAAQSAANGLYYVKAIEADALSSYLANLPAKVRRSLNKIK